MRQCDRAKGIFEMSDNELFQSNELPPPRPSVVVIPHHARRASRIDDPMALWELNIGEKLYLTTISDLSMIRSKMMSKWPHAEQVIDSILNDITIMSHNRVVAMSPTLLVGNPGVGKTSFASTLGKALGLAPRVIGCGGISDSMFGGSNRRWSNCDAAVPVNAICTAERANVLLVLDEIEKTGTGRQNGSMIDTLLGMLDPVTSKSWHDPCAEVSVDLSYLNWMFTSNDIDSLPSPFIDRCRIVRFPAPTHDHLPILVRSILHDIARSQGMRTNWIAPLAQFELDAVANTWRTGSMRGLRRLVIGVLECRDREVRGRPLS